MATGHPALCASCSSAHNPPFAACMHACMCTVLHNPHACMPPVWWCMRWRGRQPSCLPRHAMQAPPSSQVSSEPCMHATERANTMARELHANPIMCTRSRSDNNHSNCQRRCHHICPCPCPSRHRGTALPMKECTQEGMLINVELETSSHMKRMMARGKHAPRHCNAPPAR